jgi:hypothetical protein
MVSTPSSTSGFGTAGCDHRQIVLQVIRAVSRQLGLQAATTVRLCCGDLHALVDLKTKCSRCSVFESSQYATGSRLYEACEAVLRRDLPGGYEATQCLGRNNTVHV